MIFYIVHTSSGYYVGYEDKISDKYSPDYIFAKKYKTLGFALSRLGMNYKRNKATELIRLVDYRINKSLKIKRRKKLSKIEGFDFQLNDMDLESVIDSIIDGKKSIERVEINGNIIKNLGKVSNKEIYDYFKKESDKFIRSIRSPYYEPSNLELRDSTPEEIDDFCLALDSIHSSNQKHEDNI